MFKMIKVVWREVGGTGLKDCKFLINSGLPGILELLII